MKILKYTKKIVLILLKYLGVQFEGLSKTKEELFLLKKNSSCETLNYSEKKNIFFSVPILKGLPPSNWDENKLK